MEFLYLLEAIRAPLLNAVMLAVTEFGNELIFIVCGVLMFWCVDKKQGYFILLTGFFGVYINQFLKITFRIPRPWVLDPDFSVVEAARPAATGYSFPSGHTQTAVGLYGGLMLCRRERWVRIASLALVLLVPFSRMYLGVHTPADVLVSAVAAVLLLCILWPLFRRYGYAPRLLYPLMGLLAAMGVGYFLYVLLGRFPADIDPENYTHALENGYKFLGCVIGMWAIYCLDRAVIRFDTKTAVWWAQIIKLVLGFGLLLVVMKGSKPLLLWAFGGNPIAHTVRYLMTVLFMGAVWPLTFPWFSGLGRKKP